MQIHVVSAGQTLSSIGRLYQLSPGFLARCNGLTPPYALAVGQALIVLRPEQTRTVAPGDTLFSLAQQSGQSVRSLLRMNPNLAAQTALYPGQVLVTELEEAPLRQTVLTGYAYPFVRQEVLRGILPYARVLVPFTYGITEQGGLVALEDEALIALAARYQVRPFLHLSTLTESGSFSSERARRVLESPAAQQALADAVLAQMELRGYEGLDVDFEFLGAELARAYAEFLALLHKRLQPQGYPLIAALAPKTASDQPGVLYEGHDYARVGESCDAVLIMSYEWGYIYGPPMAVAPLPQVRRVLDYAVTQIPPEKILMGFPNYGYDWTLPYRPQESRARSLGNEEAPLLAVRYGAQIRFDETAQTPWFSYTDAQGHIHEVWFEDPRSARAKFDLVREYGFLGLGVWNFMRPFTAGFCLLNAMFQTGG